MPIYQFIHSDTGDFIERVYSMREEKPEVIEEGGRMYRRVFSDGLGVAVKDAGGVRYSDVVLPTSRSLERRDTTEGRPVSMDGHEVLEYPDKALTDPSGAWIIRDRNDARRAEALTGMTRID